MYSFLDRIAEYIPSVEKPKYSLDLNTKLKWTFLALILFAALSSIYPIGVKVNPDQIDFLSMIMGSKIGSLATLGIGPIVMASIILTLLKGAEFINFDLSNPVDYRRYHVLQKLFVFAFCLFEAFVYLSSGRIPHDPSWFWIIYAQIVLGGIIIVFLDEIVSKWGIGSGVSLFIAAGVSFAIVWALLNPMGFFVDGAPNGYLIQFFESILSGSFDNTVKTAFPIIVTIVVLFITVLLETIRLDLPLTARGMTRKFSLNFMYMSNIPVIFSVAFVSVLTMIVMMTMGTDSFAYYLVHHPYGMLSDPFAIPQTVFTWDFLWKILFYLPFFILLCIVFGWFWAESSGMTSEGLAQQVSGADLGMSGFRRDPRVVKKVFDRYIPYLIVISSIAVGILAVFADMFGTIGSGTGILLTVSILHRYYQQLKAEGAFENNPLLKKIFGEI